jgi:hypothetical protein
MIILKIIITIAIIIIEMIIIIRERHAKKELRQKEKTFNWICLRTFPHRLFCRFIVKVGLVLRQLN